MAEEAAIQFHRLKEGGVVTVRYREDKAAVRNAFDTRVTVAETATEVAWTSQLPLVLVIEEREANGRATIYEFETTESGYKVFETVVAAIILDAVTASQKKNGQGSGGAPPFLLLDIQRPVAESEKSPLPPIWRYRQKVKA